MPGLPAVDLPNYKELGVNMLSAESVEGKIPTGLSLSVLAILVKLVSNSGKDSLWSFTDSEIALLTDLMRASAAPWRHGLSAGEHSHFVPYLEI